MGTVLARFVGGARTALSSVVAIVQAKRRHNGRVPVRRGPQIGDLEPRLLLSAAPIDPALLAGGEAAGIQQETVAVVPTDADQAADHRREGQESGNDFALATPFDAAGNESPLNDTTSFDERYVELTQDPADNSPFDADRASTVTRSR